jgi:DNA-binding Xre family transcriptional regulator
VDYIHFTLEIGKGYSIMTLTVRVREAAQEKHIPTVAQLARRTGLTPEQVKRLWQGGAIDGVSFKALSTIGKLLGVKAKDLIVEEEER